MMRYFQLNFALLLLLAIAVETIRVDSNSSMFIDQYNRKRVYHGVNAVYKIFPFHPDMHTFSTNYSLIEQDFQNLRGWGLNSIRLHCAWQGIQPKKGQYNYTYIQTLRQIIRNANKYGVSILLDAHQDLFVKQFCGEGLPTWVVKRQSFPKPLKVKLRYDKEGFPLIEDCLKVDFAKFYLTYDVMKLQQDLFTNERGLLDHLVAMWELVAAYMASQPNLLGYEFLNEPAGVNAYQNPGDFFYPGEANNKYLLPAYKRIYKAIRKNDKYTPIFFEPSIFDVFAGGFTQTPGGSNQLQQQVFSYHIYCPLVTAMGEPKSTKFCQGFDALQVASKEQNIKDMKTGGFLTQFGALSGSIKSAQEITTITDLMQINFRSWTYWQFKYYHDITTMADPGTTQSLYDQYGNLQINKVKALARPYSYAICGIPLSETLKKGVYKLLWLAKDDCYNKKTQIFLSESFYYKNGFNIGFSKNCKGCSLQLMKGEKSSYYEVHLTNSAINHKVWITVSPK